jgi:hypothetical protein
VEIGKAFLTRGNSINPLLAYHPQGVHQRRLLQLHAPETHLQGTPSGPVWTPQKRVGRILRNVCIPGRSCSVSQSTFDCFMGLNGEASNTVLGSGVKYLSRKYFEVRLKLFFWGVSVLYYLYLIGLTFTTPHS